MNSRERVVAAIEHREPDRVPLDGLFRREVWVELHRHFETHDEDVILDELGIDLRWLCGEEPSVDFREQAVPAPVDSEPGLLGAGRDNLVKIRDNGWWEDEWGVCKQLISSSGYFHYVYHPLAEAEIDDLAHFKFPDPTDRDRYRLLRRDVQRYKGHHLTLVSITNFFKHTWELRGFDQLMMDLHLNRALVERLLDKLLAFKIEQAKNYIRSGVDIICMDGDVAMQKNMMMSPKMWREIFKPRHLTLAQTVKKEGNVYLNFHSDGNMEPIIGDLIEIGFDIINPIQPESMDPVTIKKRYGDKITLHGAIGMQHTLPFGTVDEVRAEAGERIETCGVGGGLIIAPSNTVQYDVPLENLLAVYDTVRKYKR